MLKRALVFIGFFIPVFGYAAVYQCESDGQTIFSDQPCGSDAKRIHVKAPVRMGGGPMVNERGQKFLESRDRKKEVAGIDRDIESLRRQKARAKMYLDNTLIRYQRQKAHANNNLAGATWEGSLAQEAEVMRKRYQSEIDEANRQIEQLRSQRRRVLQGD
ncbi:DUF4124 domain-containing protein [Marinobacter piscensis]|uniref:DUF4124 domain-containing protein n=1 Tax=Marinobacter piscensis TaxID=1562308 RepID=UPI00119D4BE4|nr:DUF4124 domain-containing protein [Marinobacter piscensis]